MYCKEHLRGYLLLVLLPGGLPAQGQEVLPVKVAPLADVAIYPTRSAPARVLSLNDTGIAAEIAAKVKALPVNVGDIVKKGALLVELDCRDYQLALEQASARLQALQARVALAERRLARSRQLVARQSVSEDIFDEREADLSVLRADQRAAQARLEQQALHVADCKLYSPFRALVTARIGSLGHYAEVGRPLVQVLDLDKLEVSAQVSARDAALLAQVDAQVDARVSAQADAQVDAQADTLFFEHDDSLYPLSLRTILPAINPDTRNQEVRLLFKDGPALVGAAGKLVWREARPHVPGKLIIRRQGQLGFFIYRDAQAEFIVLNSDQAGRASPATLPLETLIVTDGHFGLQAGDQLVVSD